MSHEPAERLFPPKPKKLSLFNHEKRLTELERRMGYLTPNRFDQFVQHWGAVAGLFAFILVLGMLILPTLR